MLGAGLTVLYLTQAVREDMELKNRLLVCQKARQPILILNTDGGDSGLSLGLTGNTPSVLSGESAPDAVSAIFHGPNFSQVYLGDPLPVNDHLWLRRISVLLIVLALLLGAGAGVYRYLNPPPPPPTEEPTATPEPADEVLIQDEALRAAARAAIGGGVITKEALAKVGTLSLDRLPKDTEELSVFPALTTLILSQEAAQAAPELPVLYDRYTLILAGGEAG